MLTKPAAQTGTACCTGSSKQTSASPRKSVPQ